MKVIRKLFRKVRTGFRSLTDNFYTAMLNNDVDCVKELLKKGLDPNSTIIHQYERPLEKQRHLILLVKGVLADSLEGTEQRDTLLYMACTLRRRRIVKLLLAAGADPDQPNDNNSATKPQTPLTLAIATRDADLLKLLLANNQVTRSLFQRSSMPLGIFSMRCNDSEVIRMLLHISLGAARWWAFEDRVWQIKEILNLAANLRCPKVYICLAMASGDAYVFKAALTSSRRFRPHSGISYIGVELVRQLVEVLGVRIFTTKNRLMTQLIRLRSPRLLGMVLDGIYAQEGGNIEFWSTAVNHLWSGGEQDTILHESALLCPLANFEFLIRYGVFNVCYDQTPEACHNRRPSSILYSLTMRAKFHHALAFVNLYPHRLHEAWLADYPQQGFNNFIATSSISTHSYPPLLRQRLKEFLDELVEMRRQPSRLTDLCRSVIFRQLGINPGPKAELLPLPRKLKDCIQGKGLFEELDDEKALN
jgi:hypothetical protein